LVVCVGRVTRARLTADGKRGASAHGALRARIAGESKDVW
jgi:hypothetical protein